MPGVQAVYSFLLRSCAVLTVPHIKMSFYSIASRSSTSSMKSLLTHVGSLCKMASRASAIEEPGVSPDELSSSSANTKKHDNSRVH